MPQPEHKTILKTLMDGNSRFVSDCTKGPDTSLEHRKSLLKGQQPLAVVVSCSDSRVSPEIIFDLGLGDLFVIRTAGNLVDRLALESIRYGVNHLGVRFVLVLGHSQCGAVTEAVKIERISPEHGKIANLLKPAIAEGHHFNQDPVDGAILANINRTVSNLTRSFPLSSQALDKKLFISGAIYRLEDGRVHFI